MTVINVDQFSASIVISTGISQCSVLYRPSATVPGSLLSYPYTCDLLANICGGHNAGPLLVRSVFGHFFLSHATGWITGVRNPSRGRDIFLVLSVQTGSELH